MTSVTAIMPTRARRQWAADALQCYLSQTYENKQLIILDDADDPSFPIPPRIPGVGHILLNERMTIADKRNMACRLATGEIIWHLDSDDFSAPTRMEKQVALLQESQKALVGYHSMLFYGADDGPWWFKGHVGYPMGTSQCYLKTFWENHQFRHANPAQPTIGEDTDFATTARQYNEVFSIEAGDLTMIARMHAGNTSVKEIDKREHQNWFRWEGALPQGFRP